MNAGATDCKMLSDECNRVMRLLDAAGVFCVAIGSLAMWKLGIPRTPKDIDIAIDANRELASAVLEQDGYAQGLAGLHFEKGALSVDLVFEGMPLPSQPGLVLDYNEKLPGVAHPSTFGSRCGFATAEGLIESKKNLPDQKHKDDIAELTALLNKRE